MGKVKYGESLLSDNQENKSEQDLEQRVEEQKELLLESSSESNDEIVRNFWKGLGNSGGKILEIDTYPVCDREESLRNILALRTLKGYTINKLNIKSVKIEKNYIIINDILNIPLINQKLNGYPQYFYDEATAEELVHRLNTEAYKAIAEVRDHFIKAATLMKNVAEKNLF